MGAEFELDPHPDPEAAGRRVTTAVRRPAPRTSAAETDRKSVV